MIKIAPSILSADFTRLGEEVRDLEKAGADMIHIDVMDGHFVPNITFGPQVVRAVKNVTGLLLDVHLMIEEPGRYVGDFADAGAGIITVHPETDHHLNRLLRSIREYGAKTGVALNPSANPDILDWIMDEIDMVLIMTVNPGFGGQSYIEAMTDKIASVKSKVVKSGLNIDIQADGGINLANIGIAAKAGAEIIVTGSALFSAPDRKKFIKEMKNQK